MECYKASCRCGWRLRSWLADGQEILVNQGKHQWSRLVVNERVWILLKDIACNWFNSRVLEDILAYQFRSNWNGATLAGLSCWFGVHLRVHFVNFKPIIQTHRTFATLNKSTSSWVFHLWLVYFKLLGLRFACPQLVLNSNREEKQTAQDMPRRHIFFYVHPSGPHQPWTSHAAGNGEHQLPLADRTFHELIRTAGSKWTLSSVGVGHGRMRWQTACWGLKPGKRQ